MRNNNGLAEFVRIGEENTSQTSTRRRITWTMDDLYPNKDPFASDAAKLPSVCYDKDYKLK